MSGKVYNLITRAGIMQEIQIGGFELGTVANIDGNQFVVIETTEEAKGRNWPHGQYAVNLENLTHIREISPSSKDDLSPMTRITGFSHPMGKDAALELKAQSDAARNKEAIQREEARTEYQLKIQRGKEIYESIKPAWAQSVIVAELRIDKSDPMSDYHGSTSGGVRLLGFSKHKRDLFPEMRKFAALLPETEFLATGGEEVEHREKYSMGGGFYLASKWGRNSGWQVYKDKYGSLNEVYISLADGHGLPTAKVEEKAEAPKGWTEISGNCEMTLNAERSGVELRFSEKPSEEIRTEMKATGFRWSGNQGIWYARQGIKTIALAMLLSHREGQVVAA